MAILFVLVSESVSGLMVPAAGSVQSEIERVQLGLPERPVRPAARLEQLGPAPVVVFVLGALLRQPADIQHRLLSGLGMRHMISMPKTSGKGQDLRCRCRVSSHDAKNGHVPRTNRKSNKAVTATQQGAARESVGHMNGEAPWITYVESI